MDWIKPRYTTRKLFSNKLKQFQNLILEAVNAKVDSRPEKNPEIIRSKDWRMQKRMQRKFPHLTPEEHTKLANSKTNVLMLATILNTDYIGRCDWSDKEEYERMQKKKGSFKGSSLIVLGTAHT